MTELGTRHMIRAFLLSAVTMLLACHAAAETQFPYKPNTAWEIQRDKFNMSSFAYMDRNENGSYDVGDQPLAGVVFALTKDEQELWRAASNENGFANFPGSRIDSNAPIHELGDYTFTALVPPNWRVTSDNTIQTRSFIDVPGAPMGGGLVEMMTPVGLVPPREIRGQANPDVPLTISGPGLTPQPVMLTEGGAFEVTVPEPGRFSLSSGDTTRVVEIYTYPVHVGNVRPDRPVSGTLVTLHFDDLSANWLRKVPSGYGGLDWFNINAIKNTFASGSRGYVNGATSGSFVAYTSSGHPARISHPDGFDLIEMHIAVAWPAAEGETAIFEFWRGDEKIAEDRVVLSAYAPVRYAPHMSNVTSVRISTEHYWQMVMDDLVIALKH